MVIRPGRVLACLAVAGLLAACQPVDHLELEDEEAEPAPLPGGGASGQLPDTLEGLLDRGQDLAREWQREPVLAEVAVTVAGERWRRARLLYLAADADRFLSLRFDREQVSQERVTLETLGLEPVPAGGLAGIPQFPTDALEPAALVEQAQPHVDGCLEGPPTEIIYDTGAPAAWQGSGWSDPPVWSATLWHAGGDGGGQGRRVNPVTADPVDEVCATVDP